MLSQSLPLHVGELVSITVCVSICMRVGVLESILAKVRVCSSLLHVPGSERESVGESEEKERDRQTDR